MRIGIVCYPTFGGSGVLATELGKALADKGYSKNDITKILGGNFLRVLKANEKMSE